MPKREDSLEGGSAIAIIGLRREPGATRVCLIGTTGEQWGIEVDGNLELAKRIWRG